MQRTETDGNRRGHVAASVSMGARRILNANATQLEPTGTHDIDTAFRPPRLAGSGTATNPVMIETQ